MKWPKLYTSRLSWGELDPDKEYELFKEIEKRGMLVIQSAISIEREMERLASRFFHPDNVSTALLFENIIIGTKYLTFDAKRHITMEILRLKKKEKGFIKKLDQAIRDVGHYRNAFAHGKLDLNQNKPYLKWFKTKQEVYLINDDFWKKLEIPFVYAFEELDRLNTQK